MTDIQRPTDYQAGESLTQEFTIETDSSAKDLSSATVAWYLLPVQGAAESDAVLSDSDSGVSATVVDAAAGRVDVAITQDTTTGLGGRRLWQRLVVDDTGDGKQIWGGVFPIDQP